MTQKIEMKSYQLNTGKLCVMDFFVLLQSNSNCYDRSQVSTFSTFPVRDVIIFATQFPTLFSSVISS